MVLALGGAGLYFGSSSHSYPPPLPLPSSSRKNLPANISPKRPIPHRRELRVPRRRRELRHALGGRRCRRQVPVPPGRRPHPVPQGRPQRRQRCRRSQCEPAQEAARPVQQVGQGRLLDSDMTSSDLACLVCFTLSSMCCIMLERGGGAVGAFFHDE